MHELRAGVDGFVDDIAGWRDAARARAPSYHRVFEVLVAILAETTSDGGGVRERFDEAWRMRNFRIFYDRPLLFLAALRREALVIGTAHPLWKALAAPEPEEAVVTRGALLEAL